jgi:hypothetical protein
LSLFQHPPLFWNLSVTFCVPSLSVPFFSSAHILFVLPSENPNLTKTILATWLIEPACVSA